MVVLHTVFFACAKCGRLAFPLQRTVEKFEPNFIMLDLADIVSVGTVRMMRMQNGRR